MPRRTVPFEVSRFVLAELAAARVEGVVGRETRRAGNVGPTYLLLDIDALADLAELLDPVAADHARAGNTSGARTCFHPADRARQTARELAREGQPDDRRDA